MSSPSAPPAPHITTGIVVLAHAPQGSAFEAFAIHVHGAEVPHMLAVDVAADGDHEALVAQVGECIRVRGWHQVLMLVDLIGASPYRIALKLAKVVAAPARLITGANNAMLLVALQHAGDEPDIDRLARLVVVRGRQAIRHVDTATLEGRASVLAAHDTPLSHPAPGELDTG